MNCAFTSLSALLFNCPAGFFICGTKTVGPYRGIMILPKFCNILGSRARLHKTYTLSVHLSRSLTNPSWVHLRVLHGTHLALS